MIRPNGWTVLGYDALWSYCLWTMNYTYSPSNLDCILRYCHYPTFDPNTNGANYNFTWNNLTRVPLLNTIFYPCKSNHRIENDTRTIEEADTGTTITCGDTDGEFIYPDPWPQCSDSVSCPDPGNSTEVVRTLNSGINMEYGSWLKYKCEDLRKWIKLKDQAESTLSADKVSMCEWRKVYDLDGTNLECKIHHCRHPHDEPGSHLAPEAKYQLHLKNVSNWDIPFGTSIRYECEAGTKIENEEIDPTETYIDVECLTGVGEYNIPEKVGDAWPSKWLVSNGNIWPNCTETVICGLPPDPPVNGSRIWILPAVENQETYDTHITYQCQNGSQFDTDGDGKGDVLTVTIRCQWNKVWDPYVELPPCVITHCVEPFNIPDETNLEEIVELTPIIVDKTNLQQLTEWTPIETYKKYQCKNTINGVYTMFWESDRTKSTFQLFCKDDGYFTWEDWPICLTDITCSPDPPVIPTHTEYTLVSDDGTVTVNSLIYPTYPAEIRVTDAVFNSTENNTMIAKNYMANLTYHCGSAREFFYEDESQSETQSMTCQWDKTWTPTTELGTCDWVACLKPPTPPSSTNLRVTDWFGDPIPFGDEISFVCRKGYKFEEDPSQVDVRYTCQDGSNPEHKDKKGFFDVPEIEEDWPKCLLGIVQLF